jgi:hypothetical protein
MTPHTENQNEKSTEKTFRCVHCSQVKVVVCETGLLCNIFPNTKLHMLLEPTRVKLYSSFQVFSTKVNVIKHIRQVHVSARPHTCPECDQVYFFLTNRYCYDMGLN